MILDKGVNNARLGARTVRINASMSRNGLLATMKLQKVVCTEKSEQVIRN